MIESQISHTLIFAFGVAGTRLRMESPYTNNSVISRLAMTPVGDNGST